MFSKKLGEVLAETGDFADAEGILREALDASVSSEDRADVLGALARVAHGRDRRQEARNYLKQAVELAKSGPPELAARLKELQRGM